jgi:hypothetical protein
MTGTPYQISVRLDLTVPGIRSAITSTFAGATENDVSLFFYSGHGSSGGSIVGTDYYGLSPSNLRALLDTIPGTKIVILDSCHSGGMIGKGSETGGSPAAFNSAVISAFSAYNRGDNDLASNGYIVLTASSGSQLSQSLGDGTIYFGAFTYGVCYGSGYDEWYQESLGSLPADDNGDRAITLKECHAEAQAQLRWLQSMASSVDHDAQYYGDSNYVLWSK